MKVEITDKNRPAVLFWSMLGAFLAWLAVVFVYLLPKVLANPSAIDPMMSLLSGLGIGGITQFFIAMLTISWYFFFRKRPSTPESK